MCTTVEVLHLVSCVTILPCGVALDASLSPLCMAKSLQQELYIACETQGAGYAEMVYVTFVRYQLGDIPYNVSM